eukprot:6604909-Prymnesium_polylepis.1
MAALFGLRRPGSGAPHFPASSDFARRARVLSCALMLVPMRAWPTAHADARIAHERAQTKRC